MDYLHVGDRVILEAGYYREDFTDVAREFTGFIREIESDVPLIIHCDDETYPLRKNNIAKSYRDATLKQVLTDIIPKTLTFECPDIKLGRFYIDNESSFQVLRRIMNDYGLYSRLQAGLLKVNLRDLISENDIKDVHTYVLNPVNASGNLVKINELKYKRKVDYKLHVKLTSVLPNGKRLTVDVGNKEEGISMIQVTYPGEYTEQQLRDIATGIYNKRCYDGYTGSITGFGLPRTRAGDALVIDDKKEKERSGKYMIEKVVITYNESSGYSRENTLSYRIDEK